MFASQLLRILQTIPSDVNYETCVYDSAEQDMTMKENQNETRQSSKSLGRVADPMAFGSKEHQLNGLKRDTNPSLFEVKCRDRCWNPFLDELSMDNENEAEELMHCNENKARDSRSPFIAATNLFETDNSLYTDKNVLECKPPELIVCCKEINYHVVKDICVDEGMPVSSKILTDGSKDDQSGHSFPQLLDDDNCHNVTGNVDEQLRTSDGAAATSLENTKGIISKEHGSEEESPGILLSQERPELPSEGFLDKDALKDSDPEDSMQKGLTNLVSTSKTVTHASEEESFVHRTLPIQEFGTRSFLRSFLNSLDGDGSTVKCLPDQISSGKVVSEGPATSLAEAGLMEDVRASSLSYNSKVETGNITFNFNSIAPLEGGITNGRTENVKEQSLDSRDVLDCKDADADNLSDARQVHYDSNGHASTRKVHEQTLNMKDGFPSDLSTSRQAQCVSGKDISDENVHAHSIDHEDKNSVDLSSNDLTQIASSKSTNSINSGGQAVDSHDLKHEHRDPDNAVSLRRYDEGESSFSAAGLVTYSGPIAFSGSLSLRSDGSATSGRSFAFPILQPEWNSSPVRMAKADGRHFRKHKCWRSGLLCCRF